MAGAELTHNRVSADPVLGQERLEMLHRPPEREDLLFILAAPRRDVVAHRPLVPGDGYRDRPSAHRRTRRTGRGDDPESGAVARFAVA
jgi:hypothetical protein